MENASYLQNLENVFDEKDSKPKDDMPTFEVESIELTTPELFSDSKEVNSLSYEKEPEMFEESNLEEDFEIPAFLRKQKN